MLPSTFEDKSKKVGDVFSCCPILDYSYSKLILTAEVYQAARAIDALDRIFETVQYKTEQLTNKNH